MSTENIGKSIEKIDDSSKAFQQRCLDGSDGRGIDVEGLYYAKKMDVHGKISQPEQYQYYVFEYLKCECPWTRGPYKYPESAPPDLKQKDLCPTNFSPWNSDPNKYKENWRKFYVLYKLSLKLHPCVLVLLNYSDGYIQPERHKGQGNDKPPRKPAPEGYADQVRLMYLESIDINVLNKISKMSKKEIKEVNEKYITIKEDAFYTFSEYQEWFKKLNKNSTLPPLYEAQKLFGDNSTSIEGRRW